MPIKRFTSKIVDFFFPKYCIGCGKIGDFICARCREKLPYIPDSICQQCGRPISGYDICPSCTGKQPAINGVRSVFRFDGIIKKAVHSLKYNQLTALADPLSTCVYSYLVSHPQRGDVIVPVPLHPDRLKERGYNQSELLAKKLGEYLDIPVIENCLIRTKNTVPQVQTSGAEERAHNVNGVFACRDSRLDGKYVILVDDVCTTGSTLEACAVALKKSNVSSVWGITVAREI